MIVYTAFQPKYECISDEERYKLTPATSKYSYYIPGVYVLDGGQYFLNRVARKHRFYFLPSKFGDQRSTEGKLILEFESVEHEDSLIYIVGSWKFINGSKRSLVGELGMEVRTKFPKQEKTILYSVAQNPIKLICKNGKPKVMLIISRHNFGNNDSIKIANVEESNPDLDYLNYPDIPIDEDFDVSYEKVLEIDKETYDRLKSIEE